MSENESKASEIIANVSTVVSGKDAEIRLAVVALVAGGHLLIEDVPGVGKTSLARALASSVNLGFTRIQFTSDLMPADVLGGAIYDPSTTSFQFRPGPIFTHVLLADEINRTTPKTQSALLEAMSEGQVSIDGKTHALESPFFVIATQNPEEFYGTYPLPESQLDRFLLRIRIGYPERSVERAIMERQGQTDPASSLSSVMSKEALMEARAEVARVRTEAPLLDYIHELVLATREHRMLSLGVSTRAALAFVQATRAHAWVAGRDFATPDDVKAVAVPCLAHRVRMVGGRDGAPRGPESERLIRDLLQTVPVPI